MRNKGVIPGESTRLLLLGFMTLLGGTALGAHARYAARQPVSASLDRRGYDNLVPKYDMCDIADHQSALDKDVLWVHGGYVGYFNGTQSLAPNNLLRRIDLSKPFRLDSRDEAPVTFLSVPKEVPEISEGSLFAYNGRLFEIAGHSERIDVNFPGWNDVGKTKMWTYDIGSNQWEPRDILDQSQSPLYPLDSHYSAQVPSLSKAYVFGGIKDEDDTDTKRRNLVYDFTDSSWTKLPSRFGIRRGGAMVHVPIGRRGILIPLAGRRDATGESNSAGTSSLTSIDIFNLNAEDESSPEGTWSTQIATAGDPLAGIPVARSSICAWAAVASDNSSAQVFMYAGVELNPTDGENHKYRDLWVLTIPSFQWILLDDGSSGPPNPRATQTSPGLREGHTCHLVRKSMVVMFGGRADPSFSRACETTGLYAYDLNAGKWVETYDPDKAAEQYEVPKPVFEVIGGNANGGSTKTPENGVVDANLRKLFAEMLTPKRPDSKGNGPTAKDPDSIAPRPGDAALNPPSRPLSERASSLSKGALVGTIVGGVIFVTLLLLAITFIYHRRHRRGTASDPSSTSIIDKEIFKTEHSHNGNPIPLEPYDRSRMSEMPLSTYSDTRTEMGTDLVPELEGSPWQNTPVSSPQLWQGYALPPTAPSSS